MLAEFGMSFRRAYNSPGTRINTSLKQDFLLFGSLFCALDFLSDLVIRMKGVPRYGKCHLSFCGADVRHAFYWMISYAVVVLILFVPSYLHATNADQKNQDRLRIYRHLGIESGLLSEEIYDLKLDKKGYLWIGHNKGVSRFDGKFFVHFTQNEGLSGTSVYKIEVDNDGRVWLLIDGMSIDYIEGRTVTNVLHNIQEELFQQFGIKKGSIHGITFDEIGNAQIGIYTTISEFKLIEGVLEKQAGYKASFHAMETSDSSSLYKIKATNHGSSVSSCFNIKSDKKRFIYGSHKKDLSLHSSANYFDRIIVLNDTSFLLASEKTVTHVVGEQHYSWPMQFDITNGYSLDDELLFLGTYNQGCIILDLGTSRLLEERILNGTSVSAIQKINKETIWVSTLDNGLYLISLGNYGLNQMYVSESKIKSFNTFGSDLFVLETGGHLRHIQRDQMSSAQISDYKFRVVYGLKSDDSGVNVYLDGVDRDKISGLPSFIRPKFNITNEYESKACGAIYTPKYQGLKQALVDTITSYSTDGEFIGYVKNITEDQFKNVWIHSENGLFILNQSGALKKVREEHLDHSQLDVFFLCDQGSFINVKGQGLYFKSNESPNGYHLVSGITRSGLQSMLKVEDHLYLLGQDDLYRVKIDSRPFSFERLGVPFQEKLVDLKYEDGLFCLATEKAIYSSKEFTRYFSQSSKVFLDRLYVNGEKMDIGNQIVVPASASVDFNIAYIDPIGMPENLEYQLDGSPWVHMPGRVLSLAELGWGNHSIKIRSSTAGSQAEISHDILVRRPIWARTWAIIALAFITIAILAGILFFARSRIRAGHARKYDLMTLNFRALRNQINIHFFSNALMGINNLSVKGKHKEASSYSNHLSRFFRQTLSNTESELVKIGHEIEILKSYIRMEEFRYEKDIQLQVKGRFDRDALIPAMILQPFVENAIQHGIVKNQGSGEVILRINQVESSLSIEIEDNGIGFTISDSSKRKFQLNRHSGASGTSISENRIRMYCAQNKIDDNLSIENLSSNYPNKQGTIVRFNLPISI